jgi:hypothetical protein
MKGTIYAKSGYLDLDDYIIYTYIHCISANLQETVNHGMCPMGGYMIAITDAWNLNTQIKKCCTCAHMLLYASNSMPLQSALNIRQ